MRAFLPVLLTIILVIAFCVAAVKYGPGVIERFTIASQAHHASMQ